MRSLSLSNDGLLAERLASPIDRTRWSTLGIIKGIGDAQRKSDRDHPLDCCRLMRDVRSQE